MAKEVMRPVLCMNAHGSLNAQSAYRKPQSDENEFFSAAVLGKHTFTTTSEQPAAAYVPPPTGRFARECR
ncbi:hypothetical protein [Caballeronia sp. GAFFF1]|uniref:hypothetical protein n=1 Tax=Caballeronia sp. GAFFF1 TaxID=2921779 RepID=UPI002027E9E2|nr:hypothetical protein [Caballeronia sp. GAFFF1]